MSAACFTAGSSIAEVFRAVPARRCSQRHFLNGPKSPRHGRCADGSPPQAAKQDAVVPQETGSEYIGNLWNPKRILIRGTPRLKSEEAQKNTFDYGTTNFQNPRTLQKHTRGACKNSYFVVEKQIVYVHIKTNMYMYLVM